MRPKKRVLLYCSDYDRGRDLAFVLGVRCGWAAVEVFTTTAELSEALPSPFDHSGFGCLVLVADCVADGERNVSQEIDFDWILRDPLLAGRAVEVRTKPDWARGYRETCAARRIAAGDIATLQDAMKTVAARKRGPRQRVTPPPFIPEAVVKAVA